MQKGKDMAHGNGGANTADSYIGSLISLTSKSEIRYEGILYTVDTENSNIALQNVRSFGTEGRKKDGLPIYASDKVYDYIIFRGSDIKDLQVKSSPSIQTLPQPPSDPAIISLQSQYSQSASIPPAYVQQSLGQHDAPPQLPYPGLSPSGYRSSVPQLYQSTAAWGTSLPTGPNANLAMPMYWQGYYRAPAGQHVMHQQIGPQPPPSLPQPPKAHPSQPQVPLPHDHPQAPSTEPQALVSSAQPQSPLSQAQAVQQVGSRPMPSVILSDSGVLATFAPQKAIAPSSSSFPAVISSAPASLPVSPGTPINPLSSGTATNLLQPSAVFASFPATASATLGPSIPLSLALGIPAAMQGVSAVITPAAKNPRRLVVHPQSASTNASCNRRSETSAHPLPGGFPALDESAPFSIAQKQESKTAVKPQNAISSLGQTLHQQTQPLLPLPNATTLQKQGNGIISPTYVRRGRGRPSLGRGRAMGHAQQFTEDFDFLAMNERFNKNEVWGVLGSKGESREKVTDVDEELVAERNDFSQISDGSTQKGARKKPIYVKDNFFDSLSCDALDREGGRAERTKFSEQRKIDTETFGNFPLRARGGRRSGHRGGFRGAYYGGGGYTSGKGSGYGRGRGTESAMAIK